MVAQPTTTPTASLRLVRMLARTGREQILENALSRSYRRGEVILRQGDTPSALHIVVSGVVKLTVSSPEGNEMILQLVRDGDCFGEVAVLDGAPAHESAVAVRPTKALSLPRAELVRAVHANPQLGDAVLGLMAERLRLSAERLEDAYLYDLDTRMARCLWRFAKDYGRPAADGVCVDFPLTQSELAAMLGATRVRVNVLLGGYQDAGLVRLGKGTYTVPSLDRLRCRARL